MNARFLPPLTLVTLVLFTTLALWKIVMEFHLLRNLRPFWRCLWLFFLRKCAENVYWVLSWNVIISCFVRLFFGRRSFCCWWGLWKEGFFVIEEILIALQVIKVRFTLRPDHFMTIGWFSGPSQSTKLVLVLPTINFCWVIFNFMDGWKFLFMVSHGISAETLILKLTMKLWSGVWAWEA